jgi:hypothetical protein
MKINQMICPQCGHIMYTDTDYVTCSSCNTHFYASQSRKLVLNQPMYVPPPVYIPQTFTPWPPPTIFGSSSASNTNNFVVGYSTNTKAKQVLITAARSLMS